MQNRETQLANLTSKRERWVEANRENGFEEGITNLLTELYPDNAHFIYELLQNAEDTQASVVRFILSNEDIRFEHDGKRRFNFRDVESITSIGVSAKRNDPTNIGKFGVGFKAVFAYTNTPEIHSGDFHFRINNLVVPEVLPSASADSATVFQFPFDEPKKDPAKAVAEIERGLRALADNTLLFLNHIREIEYLLPGGELGKLKRVDADAQGIGQRIEIQASKPGEDETVSHWLRYRKETSVIDEAGKAISCQVAIAFHLKEHSDDLDAGLDDEKKSKRKTNKPKARWRIVPCEPGQVSIFFPAEKETSNLRFHLHAPFASTVARDSVRDCEANEKLRDALAAHVTEALEDIRDRELLTMPFLAVLPNPGDGLLPFYEPIREAIVEAFQEKDLLPTKSGSHLAAGFLYRGPADISHVIDDSDLSLLSGFEPPLWAENATQRHQREDKFLDSLEIEDWGWEELKEATQKTRTNAEYKAAVEKWISEKSDQWLLQFYALMEDCHKETHYPSDPTPLEPAWKSLLAVRVVDSEKANAHVSPRHAYFAPAAEMRGGNQPREVPAKIRFVKPEVYEKGRVGENAKKKARDFLGRVGVRDYDERAEIERRLESYPKPPGKVGTEHFSDLRLFIAFLNKNSTQAKMFQGKSFLLATAEAQNGLSWARPEDVFLDDPYEPTGLVGLTAVHKKRTLWPGYLESLGKDIKREGTVAFLKTIGVFHGLTVSAFANWGNNLFDRSFGRFTHTGFNIDWTIDGLVDYLRVQNQAASRLVWMALLKADGKAAIAEYRPNREYETQRVPSWLVQCLRSYIWIPDQNGVFHKPQDMNQEMLPKEFPYDDSKGLLTAIGFGEKARAASAEFRARDADAKKLGFASASELAEAHELLRAKREGRIREINQNGASAPIGDGSPAGGLTSTGQKEKPSTGIGSPDDTVQDGAANPPPVWHRISERIRQVGGSSTPPSGPPEPPGDDDDYTPAAVDYTRRIARAEERNANEIAQLEHEQGLQDKVNTLPRYSYGWCLALLELECLASGEKNADGKTLSIGFGRVERDATSPRTIILKEPSRFIPQSVEEFSGVRVDLEFRDGRSGKLHVESFTAKEFSLLGKLNSIDELAGVDLSQVVEARIDVQNPSFLLQELLNRFRDLGFNENFDLKANLTPFLEFVFGPPGTGKTTHLAEKVLIPLMRGPTKPKVLVLTPTNKAADVLATRVMDLMGADTSYRDWLVRFGTSADDQIELAGVWRDRSFNFSALDRSVTITTTARYAYDGFAGEHCKLHELDWDVIVFDEASMIPLVSIILPLYQQKPQKFIVAGDPFQIEPVVMVEQWKGENIYFLVGLDQPGSFAKPRTQPRQYPVTNLETQYRSILVIGEIFSRFTYNGILKHHRSAGAQRPLRIDGNDFPALNLVRFPVSKFESIYRAKTLGGGSPYQTYSALFTFEFIRWLAGQIQKNHPGEPPFRIGIIAPYRAQANLLSKLNDSLAATPGSVEIQVGTVHGFQGDECDIIIAVFNPPPAISASGRMFLNKQNILNVAISRARDYLFIMMPDAQTEGIGNLLKVARIENLVKHSGAFAEFQAHDIEAAILGSAHYLEENTFSTGHQMVNVYLRPERYYEVRSDDSAIDIQIHENS